MDSNRANHHGKHTIGAWRGHIFRRTIHVSMLFIPLLYYAYAKSLAYFLHINLTLLLVIFLALTILLELVRCRIGFVIFGQRSYEAKKISAFAWGIFSIIVVFLFSPGPEFSIPLIWSLALVDPFLGELRFVTKRVFLVELAGTIFVLLIWSGCSYWFGISLWWGVFLAPITVAAESLRIPWIDDNALMLLVPLGVIVLYGVVA